MFRVKTPIIRSIICWVGAYGFLHRVCGWVVVLRAAAWVVCTVPMVTHRHRTIGTVYTSRTAPSSPYSRPTQRLSRPPPIQKLGAENHMLQLNIECPWWWAYVPETCRAKNTSTKLPRFIKLAFHFISWGRCTVKQSSLLKEYCAIKLFSTQKVIPLILIISNTIWFTINITVHQSWTQRKPVSYCS